MHKLVDTTAIVDLARQVGQALLQAQAQMVTAESCSGGGVAYFLTEVAGSSDWFERGFVTYTNQAKQDMLGVAPETLQQYGAVSEPTVIEMVNGALHNSPATIAVAISGIAGPSGGSKDKPVGTVCFAWGRRDRAVRADTQRFPGDRHEVRMRSITYALQGVLAEFS